jgi:anti-sigma factor RsiW
MPEHVTEWLGAYHDGELHGARLRQVEEHLAGCAACRAELEEMRSLSGMLQSDVPVGEFLSAERFAANLALSLSRGPSPARPQSLPRRFLKIGWWLIPALLLGAWLFLEITQSLSALLTLAADAGLLQGDLAWLQGKPAEMAWYAAAMSLFGGALGDLGRAALAGLQDAHLFLARLAGIFIPQVLIAAAYLGWLLAWWLRQQGTAGFETRPTDR